VPAIVYVTDLPIAKSNEVKTQSVGRLAKEEGRKKERKKKNPLTLRETTATPSVAGDLIWSGRAGHYFFITDWRLRRPRKVGFRNSCNGEIGNFVASAKLFLIQNYGF